MLCLFTPQFVESACHIADDSMFSLNSWMVFLHIQGSVSIIEYSVLSILGRHSCIYICGISASSFSDILLCTSMIVYHLIVVLGYGSSLACRV